MADFKAIVIREKGGSPELGTFSESDLMDGDVTVRVSHSTLNYKDGLALTGKAPVVRRFPMIPGIDFAGTVEHSSHPGFKPGDAGLSASDAMAIGTAGYTAMLCVMALERHGLTPAAGPALVTGAAGGVGSVAVALLAKAGWHVIASTGRPSEAGYLKELGAAEILDRAELAAAPKPLAKERWAAAVDSVGSTTLANVLSMTKYRGAVAACGLAAGMDLPGSVAPFILRNVALLGVDSVMAPRELRIAAWTRLARDLDRDKLRAMTTTVGLDGVMAKGAEILAGQVRGRTVVAIG